METRPDIKEDPSPLNQICGDLSNMSTPIDDTGRTFEKTLQLKPGDEVWYDSRKATVLTEPDANGAARVAIFVNAPE
jgi:hypothetical protein